MILQRTELHEIFLLLGEFQRRFLHSQNFDFNNLFCIVLNSYLSIYFPVKRLIPDVWHTLLKQVLYFMLLFAR